MPLKNASDKPSTSRLMRNLLTILTIGLGIGGLALAAEQKAGAKSSQTQHKIVSPTELVWADVPPGLPPGAKMAVLDGDPTKPGSFTVRMQSPDGYKIAPHTHPTAEHITVISGSFHLGMGDKFDEAAGEEMGPGSFAVLPAGMTHFGWVTGDTVVQIHGEGPFKIKYVNPADDPRNARK